MNVKIGIVREIKNNEYRVAMHHAGVEELIRSGHEVVVEKDAGVNAGFTNTDYEGAGAQIADTAESVWGEADLLLKVKEPLESEYGYLREDQILFTYLHLAASRSLTQALLAAKTPALAYEMVKGSDGSLPLLAPMSIIAGRLSAQVAAHQLMSPFGGTGVLMGGAPGTARAKVLVVGGGVVGEQAAIVAAGMGASVTVLDINSARLADLDRTHGTRISTGFSNAQAIDTLAREADVVVGSVLLPGRAAPKLIKRETIEAMRPGSIVIDVAIDQGGCTEVSRPTTHDDPTFRVGNATVYCVANMPGAVARTASVALAGASLPYVRALANGGIEGIAGHPGLLSGFSTFRGELLHEEVAEAHGLPYRSAEEVLAHER